MIALANSCGASCGKLWPIPPVMTPLTEFSGFMMCLPVVGSRSRLPKKIVACFQGLPGPAVGLVLRRHLVTGELKTYLCNAPAPTPLATLGQLSACAAGEQRARPLPPS